MLVDIIEQKMIYKMLKTGVQSDILFSIYVNTETIDLKWPY